VEKAIAKQWCGNYISATANKQAKRRIPSFGTLRSDVLESKKRNSVESYDFYVFSTIKH
jgi:hypothetical protein